MGAEDAVPLGEFAPTPSGHPLRLVTLADGLRLGEGAAQDALPLLPDGGFGVVLTDPPYVAWQFIVKTFTTEMWDVVKDLEWQVGCFVWTAAWFGVLVRKIRADGCAWVFTNVHYVGIYLRLAALFGQPWRQMFGCPPDELLLYFGPPLGEGRAAATAAACRAMNTYGQGKAAALLDALLAVSPPGPVLDPFMGSGGTLLAARRAGRARGSWGVELDADSFTAAHARLRGGFGEFDLDGAADVLVQPDT